ncbi:MAG TPA: transcriptional activator NhaR [Vicinamibacterales bacterium]|nr:transcriptional activator NhaR [Vicinamibacterales bacterium]
MTPDLQWLNYHHLLYFWTIVREGSVSKAAERLRLSQPTVSAQIRKLEGALEVKLFERHGRGLRLTDAGRVVYQYADDIFPVGREMIETLRGRPTEQRGRITIGIANAVPKLIVHRLLKPLLHGGDAPHLLCVEDNTESLLTRVAAFAVDVVIADRPAPPHARVKVFNHALGESAMTFFAAAAVAARLRRTFPRSLDGQPMLLPAPQTAVRQALDTWFDAQRLRPRILAEFEDSALLKAFGRESNAVFAAPSAIAADVKRLYQVASIGQATTVRETYYAISAQRRVTHPGVLAITRGARAGWLDHA